MPNGDLLSRLRAERRAVMAQSRPQVDAVRHPGLHALAAALRDVPAHRRKFSWRGRRFPIVHSLTARYACDPTTMEILVGSLDL